MLAVLLPHLGRDALEIEPTVLPAKDLLGVRGQVYDFWCGRDPGVGSGMGCGMGCGASGGAVADQDAVAAGVMPKPILCLDF